MTAIDDRPVNGISDLQDHTKKTKISNAMPCACMQTNPHDSHSKLKDIIVTRHYAVSKLVMTLWSLFTRTSAL